MVNLKDVEKFFKEYRAPIPTVPVLTWSKKTTKAEREKFGPKERIELFFNMYTSQKGYSLEEILPEKTLNSKGYTVFKQVSRDIERYYIHYIKNLDSLIVGKMSLDCRSVRNNNLSPRDWIDRGKILITRDKRFYYQSSNWAYDGSVWRYAPQGPVKERAKIEWDSPFKISNIPLEEAGMSNEAYDSLTKEIVEMFPRICNVGANKMIDITSNSYSFETFLMYKEPKISKGPKQKKINELVSIKLSEIKYEESFNEKMAFIEKVSDGLCVIRTMMKNDNEKKMIDAARIYVSKKEAVGCRPDNSGNWVNMVLKSNSYNWDFSLYKFDKDTVKGTMLEYFGDIVDDVPKNVQGKFIQAMITYPVIEQLAKAGMKPFVINQIKGLSWSKAIEPFEDAFGQFDMKKKSLTDKLGINKYQLKVISEIMNNSEESYHRWGSQGFKPLVYMKQILSEEGPQLRGYRYEPIGYVNISYVDNETFNLLLNNLIEIDKEFELRHSYWDRRFFDYIESLHLLREIYSNQTMLTISKSLSKIAGVQIEVPTGYGYSRRDNITSIYKDYLNMVKELSDPVHFRPNFETVEDIDKMHEAIITVYNLKRDEIQAKEFDKISRRWNKWLFEDDDYAIVAPATPNDIAQEGLELHHCVRSYISKVLAKTTNILFLRKKNEIDKPFFTIEITNDGAVQQIHGFSNRNLDTEPSAEPFIKKWVKERKLKLTNFNKVR